MINSDALINIRKPLINAITMTSKRLSENPDNTLLQLLERQLNEIDNCVKRMIAPEQNLKDRINIGTIAARELESSDPMYAEFLMKTNYYFNRL